MAVMSWRGAPLLHTPCYHTEETLTTFEDIFHLYRDFVFRICSRYTPCRADAEDMTQDVIIKVVSRMSIFYQKCELSTWIYRVAVNHCLDQARKYKREEKLLAEFHETTILEPLESGGDRVLARIELDRILCRFRPMVRQILFLTLADGLSHAQAAKALGMSQAAISKTVTRFKQRRSINSFGAQNRHKSNKILSSSDSISNSGAPPASNRSN